MPVTRALLFVPLALALILDEVSPATRAHDVTVATPRSPVAGCTRLGLVLAAGSEDLQAAADGLQKATARRGGNLVVVDSVAPTASGIAYECAPDRASVESSLVR